jgi:type I restriction enzyme S subunit
LDFRAYAFKTTSFLAQAARMCEGSGVRYVITLRKFRQLTVRYPSEKSEQAAIAAVLCDMDEELRVLEARREKTLLIKQGMMQELLTGRTRLVEAAP